MAIKNTLSETLENLGFTRADKVGLSLTKTPNKREYGTFFNGGWAGMINTVAVDENGWMWVKEGHLNLTSHGFKNLPNPTVH